MPIGGRKYLKSNSQGSYPLQSESFKGSWGLRVKSVIKEMLRPIREHNIELKKIDDKHRQEGEDMMAGRERY